MNVYSMGSFYLAGSVQFRYVVHLEGLKDCVSLWDLFMDLTTCKAKSISSRWGSPGRNPALFSARWM
jgi:hypothetical protein